MPTMKLAIDVHYKNDDYAIVSGVLFPEWELSVIKRVVNVRVDEIKPYKSGRFFERELPCVLALLESINEGLEFIIIDGYVTLGAEERDGLGMHLYRSLGKSTPIIGVAKNCFSGTPEECQVIRGNSKRPLYVTAAGISLYDAKSKIESMHGDFRMPTVLKRADSECRGAIT